MSNDNNRKATQVDQGWRSGDAKAERRSTQVDTVGALIQQLLSEKQLRLMKVGEALLTAEERQPK